MNRGTRRAVLMLCLFLAAASRGSAALPLCPDRVFFSTFTYGTLFPWSNQTCGEVEPNGDPASAPDICSIDLASIGSVGDHDYYELPDLPIGTFTLETNSGTPGQCAGIDTLIELRTNLTSFIASDDNSGVNNCSLITWRPSDVFGGPFYVDVSSVSGIIPAYGLTVRMDVPEIDEVEPNDTLATANPYCSMIRGTVEYTGMDFFSFAVTSGSTIVVDSNDGTAGSCVAIDSFVIVYDSAGVVKASDDDGGINACSHISVVADSTGTWFVSISEFGNDMPIPLYGLAVTVTP